MRKFEFSKREVKEIIISMVALSFIFSYPRVLSRPDIVLTYLFVLGIAFLGHELSHKFVAMRLGYFSEYRMWSQGLLLALIFALASGGSIVFAAPGAVVFGSYFFSHPTKDDIGKIGAAGPLFNIIFTFIFYVMYILFSVKLFHTVAFVNMWLGIFNLIPIPPLDGSKIFAWNPKIWALIITPAIVFFGFLF
jgi:Zn-dependent protease